jgi:DNA gyrase subunit A
VFREQKRGGKGRSGMTTKDEDAVTNLFVTSTHNPVLFFSNLGRVYRMKVWRLPEGGPHAKGRPMVNLLPLAEGEVITAVLPLPEDEAEWGGLHIMFATAHGRSPQQHGRLHQHSQQRQDRDEVRDRRRRAIRRPADRSRGC